MDARAASEGAIHARYENRAYDKQSINPSLERLRGDIKGLFITAAFLITHTQCTKKNCLISSLTASIDGMFALGILSIKSAIAKIIIILLVNQFFVLY